MSELSAMPAVRCPEVSASSTFSSEITSVASAVDATGPGTSAAAASSTMTHRSSTLPPAPPRSSDTATPKIPSWARPSYAARQASGSPCSTRAHRRDGAGRGGPTPDEFSRSKLFFGAGGGYRTCIGHRLALLGLGEKDVLLTRTCSNGASVLTSSRLPLQQDTSIVRGYGGGKFLIRVRIVFP